MIAAVKVAVATQFAFDEYSQLSTADRLIPSSAKLAFSVAALAGHRAHKRMALHRYRISHIGDGLGHEQGIPYRGVDVRQGLCRCVGWGCVRAGW